MKKLCVIALLAGGGFFIYQHFFSVSEAYAAYESFADAMLYDRFEEAKGLTTSPTVTGLIEENEQLSQRAVYRTMRGVIHGGPVRRLESEVAGRDGRRVTLKVVQEVRRGPVTMAPIGKPTVRHQQKVVVVQTPKGWRVDEFEEQVEPLAESN